MEVYDLLNGITITKTVPLKGGKVTQGQVSEEGLYLGLATEEGRCQIINLRYFDIESDLVCHKGRVEALSFTNDSRYMLSVSEESGYHFMSLMKQEGVFAKVAKYWLICLFLGYWALVLL